MKYNYKVYNLNLNNEKRSLIINFNLQDKNLFTSI